MKILLKLHPVCCLFREESQSQVEDTSQGISFQCAKNASIFTLKCETENIV